MRQKAPKVARTVIAPPAVHASSIPGPPPVVTPVINCSQAAPTPSSTCSAVRPQLLQQLQQLIQQVPDTGEDNTDEDVLAIFAKDPTTFADVSVGPDELWEDTLNPLFHKVFGWGLETKRNELVRHRKRSLDGFFQFVEYFVVERGIDIGLVQPKLEFNRWRTGAFWC